VRIRRAGSHALLAETDSLQQAERLYAELRRRESEDILDAVVDIVPAARSVLLIADPARSDHAALESLAAQLPSWDLPGVSAGDAEPVRIPVVYDGADLAEVARLTGLDPDDVVARHTDAECRVAFCGFAPGFAYLTGTAPELHVPRRPEPRTSVPAGSVGLAGEFTGVYPRPSPGGWQLIGRTSAPVWDADREPPALLAPGTRVRFVAVDG
jgi:KipI family sensor histidine kinase inhibitor